VRPEAIVFVIAVGIVVLTAVIRRLLRSQPVDERRDRPFPYATPGQYAYGAALAALAGVAAVVGRAAIFGGRVVAEARPGGRRKEPA